jgi:hypothetical protein
LSLVGDTNYEHTRALNLALWDYAMACRLLVDGVVVFRLGWVLPRVVGCNLFSGARKTSLSLQIRVHGQTALFHEEIVIEFTVKQLGCSISIFLSSTFCFPWQKKRVILIHCQTGHPFLVYRCLL